MATLAKNMKLLARHAVNRIVGRFSILEMKL